MQWRCMISHLGLSSSLSFSVFFSFLYICRFRTVSFLYAPPNTSLRDFNNNYSNLLTKLNREKNKLYIAVDININLLNYEQHVSDHMPDFYISEEEMQLEKHAPKYVLC